VSGFQAESYLLSFFLYFWLKIDLYFCSCYYCCHCRRYTQSFLSAHSFAPPLSLPPSFPSPLPPLQEQWTQELLEREARLAEYISVAAADFKSRKFVPPSRPIACEEEAEQMVACYREKGGKEGGKEGGVVKGCNGLVDLYEKCARKVVQGLEVRQ